MAAVTSSTPAGEARLDPAHLGEKLEHILRGRLDFHGQQPASPLHAIHAFAAKFPPQLPRVFIEALTGPGETVLDPMCGSGTALVEAILLDRSAIGVDIDPLALLQSRVKTTPLDPGVAAAAVRSAGRRAEGLMANASALRAEFKARFDRETKKFIEYWFLERTRLELMALLRAIEAEARDDVLRQFLEVVFSSLIVTKSGGVSLARDLAHSRPHLDVSKRPENAIKLFLMKGVRAAEALKELSSAHPAKILEGDARKLPLGGGSVQLVVTSPPYANAIDYPRAHKFSLVWLGYSLSEIRRLLPAYIGTERVRTPYVRLPGSVEEALSRIRERDWRRERVVRQYFTDMAQVMREIYRVLEPGRAAVLVVGPSTCRGLRIDTPTCIATLGKQAGLEVVGIGKRRLDRDRRMLPVSSETNESGIELRVHEEAVIGFLKPR
jgi:DNA modification methylase